MQQPEDFEEEFVTLEIVDDTDLQLLDSEEVRILDEHSEQPLFLIGQKIFRGTWSKLIGTELVVDPASNEFVSLSRSRCALQRVELVPKDQNQA